MLGSSPVQRRYLRSAGMLSLAAAERYADAKAERHDCESACRERGITFIPIIAESFGGWGHEAQRVLKCVTEARAARTGLSAAQSLEYAYQQLAIIMWRSNAKAVQARLEQPTTTSSPFASATSALVTEHMQHVVDSMELDASPGAAPHSHSAQVGVVSLNRDLMSTPATPWGFRLDPNTMELRDCVAGSIAVTHSGARSCIAVSYTHLTLPTIREV